jgi:predicted nucleotidyltransferase
MDTESLLKSLRDSDVDFVVIGGLALPVHGYARATLDVDLFIRPTPENARRMVQALKRFGYDVTDITADDLLRYKLLIRQYLVEADIHPFVKGVTFEQVWANKVEGQIGRAQVYFPSFDDLIQMKRAAGRPRDLEDVEHLMLARERRQKEGRTDPSVSGS